MSEHSGSEDASGSFFAARWTRIALTALVSIVMFFGSLLMLWWLGKKSVRGESPAPLVTKKK
jgi:hypothetical protein